MGRDSTKGHVQIAEGQACASSTETAMTCKTCGASYKNRYAFAYHRRLCKFTNGPEPKGEGQAASRVETSIKCESCANIYTNRFAFAGHRRHCKAIKEPEQSATTLPEDEGENKMLDRNSEEVIAIWGQPMTEAEWDALVGLVMLRSAISLADDEGEQLSPLSLAATSPKKDCKEISVTGKEDGSEP